MDCTRSRDFKQEIFEAERGSDELLSQSGAVSNGAAMSPQPHHAADNNNDAKKYPGFMWILFSSVSRKDIGSRKAMSEVWPRNGRKYRESNSPSD
ncbi:polypyrimidine tract-binding protein 1-like isoform X8 [Vespula squamosa]|uniref:Polypyrimidine tract-binding protein 1-like isoform X8 n=1 Tax=Vespula squamosa TaxID=30214 RepID=A0ABD2AEP7_VESSQ